MLSFRTSIRARLAAITLVIVLMTLFALSFALYGAYAHNTTQQQYSGMQASTEQLSHNVSFYFNNLSALLRTAMSNSALVSTLAHPASNALQALEKRRIIEDFLSGILVTPQKDILSVYILSADEIYRGGKYPATLDTITDYTAYAWYRQAIETGRLVVVPAHTEQLIQSPSHTVFSLARSIYSPYNAEVIGVIKADASSTGLQNLCEQMDCGETGGVVLVDAEGEIVLSTLPAQSEPAQFIAAFPHTDNPVARIHNASYLCNSAEVEDYGLSLLSFRSTESDNAMRLQQLWLTIGIAALCCALAVVAVLWFSSGFVSPLLRMVRLMQAAEQGNMQVEFQEPRKDEIGYLGSAFNKMLKRIDEANQSNLQLTRQVYEARELQHMAELHALQAQIQPHFLCNALNMVSLQVQTQQAETAVENINRLSRLMRALTNLNRYIPLGQELGIVRDYLEIQAARFGDRLHFCINVEECFLSCLLPALTLQPLVENSVIHGCERQTRAINISVRSTPDTKEAFCVVVSDDGTGMDPATLQELRCRLAQPENESPENSGVGLINIQQRLLLYYGAGYGLQIESSLQHGTQIILRLPMPDQGRSASQ